MMLSSPASTALTRAKPKLVSNVLCEIRFVGKEYWIEEQETQRHYRKSGRYTTFSCLNVMCNCNEIPVVIYIINNDLNT